MPNTYTIIKDEIPISFANGGQMVWGPAGKYVYHRSGYNWPDKSYLYQYDRVQKKLLVSAKVANPWGAFGSPAVDLEERVYYTDEAILNGVTSLTYERQPHFRFFPPTFSRGAAVQRLDASGDCFGVFNTSGGYRVDLYSLHKLWWHIEGSDLDAGSISCFSQETLCSTGVIRIYTVSREQFGSLSGFFTGSYRVRDVDSDAAGNLWVYVSDVNRHDIFKVNYNGFIEYRRNVANVMPTPTSASGGEMKWYQPDNSLIISNRAGFIKYSIGDDAVTAVLPGVGYTFNRASFHHPDQRLHSLWLGKTHLDVSVSVPPGAGKDFPAFQEIKLDTLELGQFLVCREIGQEYPFSLPQFPFITRFFSPTTALQDPDSGCIWAEHGNLWHLGVFCFEGVTGVGGGDDQGTLSPTEFCIPRTVDISVSDRRSTSIGPDSRRVRLETVDRKTTTLN